MVRVFLAMVALPMVVCLQDMLSIEMDHAQRFEVVLAIEMDHAARFELVLAIEMDHTQRFEVVLAIEAIQLWYRPVEVDALLESIMCPPVVNHALGLEFLLHVHVP